MNNMLRAPKRLQDNNLEEKIMLLRIFPLSSQKMKIFLQLFSTWLTNLTTIYGGSNDNIRQMVENFIDFQPKVLIMLLQKAMISSSYSRFFLYNCNFEIVLRYFFTFWNPC